jgi:repressor LexA
MSPRQQDVLNFIIKFKQVNGYSPTIREIARGINTNSINHVHTMIAELQEKGYIKFVHGKQRTIVVLKFE